MTEKEQYLIFNAIYDLQPDPKELIERINEARRKHLGTEVDDDLQLALAKAYEGDRNTREALEILDRLIKLPDAKKLTTGCAWRGVVTDEEAEVIRLATPHWRAHPDLTADHALLQKADLLRVQGDKKEAWSTLEILRAKYPKGYMVAEDSRLLSQLRDKDKRMPQHFLQGDRDPYSVVLGDYRRAPLRGLLMQLALCADGGRPADDQLRVSRDLLKLYSRALTTAEAESICRSGQRLVAAPEAGKTLSGEELGEMKALFEVQLEKVRQDRESALK